MNKICRECGGEIIEVESQKYGEFCREFVCIDCGNSYDYFELNEGGVRNG